MEMKIYTQYPINILESDKEIFDKVKDYIINVSQTKRLKKVFVTNNGLVLKNGILNTRSGLNLKSKNDHTFYFSYWKTALEQYIVCRFGKSIPSINLKENTYLLIHSKWLNYSFWITEYLQRLVRVEKEMGLKNIILLYPEEWDDVPYIKETLSAFQIEKFRIPSGYHLFIENLIFPEVREITAYFNPEHIQPLRSRLIFEAKKRSKLTDFPKKIYITRGVNVKRTIVNEFEIQQCLKDNEFEIISFEKKSVWDQIMYMNNADIIFTNHGAGFANVIFMEPKKVALEFLEKDFAHYANPFPHWKLASAVNVHYAYQLCRSNKTIDIQYIPLSKTTGKERIEHVDRNIIVNVKELLININFCESKINT
jgi:hypothetical protein